MVMDSRPDSVWLFYNPGADAVAEKSKAIFQRPLSDEEYIKLIDAWTGEIVRIDLHRHKQSDGVFIPMIFLKLIRTISINGQSHEVKVVYSLSNDGSGSQLILQSFQIPKEAQGKGLGTQMFAAQVEAARTFGFDQIVAYANKNAGLAAQMSAAQVTMRRLGIIDQSVEYTVKCEDQNGYYTWPRLGFDKRLTPEEQTLLPPKFASMIYLSEIMNQPEGRDWWRNYGFASEVTFDTSPQSRSMQSLQAALGRLAHQGGYWDSGPNIPLHIEPGAYLRPRRDWQRRIWKYRQH